MFRNYYKCKMLSQIATLTLAIFFSVKGTVLKVKPALRNESGKMLVLCRMRGSGPMRPKWDASSRAGSF